METLITNGIRVSVRPSYQAEHSQPRADKYVYSYYILIENLGDQTVQLLRRHWIIWDSNGSIREVEGEGVVGEQPVLAPGEQHEYSSWCDFQTSIGSMAGAFLMHNLEEEQFFHVEIPLFRLIAPEVLN
ncbi:MAG TPA: Co2+/Mg2+ efflux protein ApaG [Saprospiraceae bacterium]|nr:Co2+/Mg2+ efflux protein ApaG [Saprospiraceae bacterium]HMQ81697.1 Co2+/Mg2+ efflux protein ApaG [Saprospiraceae bacterium]